MAPPHRAKATRPVWLRSAYGARPLFLPDGSAPGDRASGHDVVGPSSHARARIECIVVAALLSYRSLSRSLVTLIDVSLEGPRRMTAPSIVKAIAPANCCEAIEMLDRLERSAGKVQ